MHGHKCTILFCASHRNYPLCLFDVPLTECNTAFTNRVGVTESPELLQVHQNPGLDSHL